MPEYPPEAFAPSGETWWEMERVFGGKQRFGVTKRLAAWIHFNMEVGSIVTMRELRSAITNQGSANTDEHFNRRFRELRDAGWKLTSGKEDSSLSNDKYRLDERGLLIWIEGVLSNRTRLSDRTRRLVLERDGMICQVCSIGAGEEYLDAPGSRARMTVGHIRANALGGDVDILNLRTECARCNEPLRDEASSGEAADTIWPRIRRLSKADKETLLLWLGKGRRPSTEIAMIFDTVVALPDETLADFLSRLREATSARDLGS